MRSRGALAGAVLIGLVLALSCVGAAVLGATVAWPPKPSARSGLAGIPVNFLDAYRRASARFELGLDGWSYLAAIGAVESDHGRSTATGVRLGQNAHGCCAGPMQIHNGFGTGAGTWGAYATDGDGDGRTDIYAPADAVFTAANYLRASGAPTNWPTAIFAYNHASWYVDDVLGRARAYREAASGDIVELGDGWLGALPSFPGERCDTRIVDEVERISRSYRLRVTDCFGGAPHDAAGEHPLGLAVDWVPADGDWQWTLRLAEAAGWRTSCAASGCPQAGAFRVVLYNGYPGHGDPAHSSRPHLHVSWAHGLARPFSRAPWVRLVLAAP
jgi:hypothetical protein